MAWAWQSWCDFWFRAGDPSTLGFMRILAGIFIVYTHLAYSSDLQEFFGKDAWVDLPLAEQYRQDSPVFPTPLEWEDAPLSIYLPQDIVTRRAFLAWARALPLDKSQRAAALQFLENLSMDERGRAGFAFAQLLLIRPKDDQKLGRDFDDFIATPAAERATLLAELVDPPADAKKIQRIPEFLLDLKPEERRDVRDQIERLIATMPPEPGKVSRIFGHFAFQASLPLAKKNHTDPRTEFHRTLNFLKEKLRDDAKGREVTMAYLERWGIDPDRTFSRGQYTWSIWFHVTDPRAMALIHAIFIGFMVTFTLGLFTRVSAVMTWLAVLCYIHRSNQVLFGMDTMMNINLIYLMIAPSGATFSLDRWLAKRRAQRVVSGAVKGDAVAAQALLRGPALSVAANFATRLFQIHFCFIYMASGLAKLKGGMWWSGNAIWYTVANPEFSPVVFGPYRWALNFLAEYRLLWEIAMSAGVVFTLVVEIGLPFLIWRPRLRPYVLIAAIMLHVGIATFMGLTVFSIFMMVLLMAYIPPTVVRRWADSGGRLFEWPRMKA